MLKNNSIWIPVSHLLLIMKKSISLFLLILVFIAAVVRAETAEEWREKGVSAFEVGFYDVAITCFKKAVAIDPNDSESLLNIGIAYSKKRKTKEAISYYQKTIAADPNSAEAHHHLGIAYNEKGNVDKAISSLKNAVNLDNNNADAHALIGDLYLRKALKSLAADHIYKAGLLYIKQGHRESALFAYDVLKEANSKELEQSLFEKLHPELKQKKREPSK